jgi:hypothetical protein
MCSKPSTVFVKYAVFWDVTPCGSCENRRFEGRCRLHHQGENNKLVIAKEVPSSVIPFTLMMKATRSSETSILKRAKLRHIPEDGIPHSHHQEYLKSYRALTGWAL